MFEARLTPATYATTHHEAASDGYTCSRCGARVALRPGTYPAGARVTIYADDPGGSWRSRHPPTCEAPRA